MFITLLLKIFNGNTKFKNTYDAKCEGERHREGEGANLESKHLPKSRYKVQCKLKYLAADNFLSCKRFIHISFGHLRSVRPRNIASQPPSL